MENWQDNLQEDWMECLETNLVGSETQNQENWVGCLQDPDELGFPSEKLGVLVGQLPGELEGGNVGKSKAEQID